MRSCGRHSQCHIWSRASRRRFLRAADATRRASLRHSRFHLQALTPFTHPASCLTCKVVSHIYLTASLSVKLSSQLHYQHHWRVETSKFCTVKWIFPGWLPLAAGRVNLVQVGISIIREAQRGNCPPVKGLFQSVFHTEEISGGTAKPSTWHSAAHWAGKLQIRKDPIRCKASAFPFCSSWPFLTLNASPFSFCLCFSFRSYPADQTSHFIRMWWFYMRVSRAWHDGTKTPKTGQTSANRTPETIRPYQSWMFCCVGLSLGSG